MGSSLGTHCCQISFKRDTKSGRTCQISGSDCDCSQRARASIRTLMGLIEPVYLDWVSKVFRIVQTSRVSGETSDRVTTLYPARCKKLRPTHFGRFVSLYGNDLGLEDVRKMTPGSIGAKCHTLAVI